VARIAARIDRSFYTLPRCEIPAIREVTQVIPRIRLRNHGLGTPAFADATAVIEAFGAVQAQDYPGGLWGIAQRTKGDTARDLERAIEERHLVRTWPMRGTLHFVDPALVRSMLRVLTPRVVRRAGKRYQDLGLDAAVYTKARAILERTLRDGPRTRKEVYDAFARGKIDPNEQRGIHLIGRAAMDGLICLGPRQGKQFTYVLLDEWLPKTKVLDDDALLAELARRYFATHGPATVNDFAWWTGLSLTEARRATKPEWETRAAKEGSAHLLPAWDEFTVGYRDRSDIVEEKYAKALRGGVLSPVIVVDGTVIGTWTRKGTTIHARPFRKITAAQQRLVDAAIERYGRFIDAHSPPRSSARSRSRHADR
jgi:hypothetical protein